MEANLFNLLYLFFRLSPFIIASFFSLISVFNNDLKGFIYLVGLVFTTAIAWILGRSIIPAFGLDKNFPEEITNPEIRVDANGVPNVCNFLSLGGFHNFSKVPLSIVVLSYTFFYLVFTIATYHMELFNIPTLILFPILILADIFWNTSNQCFPLASCILSLIVGGGLGVAWSAIIQKNMPDMQYLIIGSNRQMCMQPSEQTFVCTGDAIEATSSKT